jgi:hypothetical protein
VEVKKHIQRMASAGCSTPALRLIYVRQQHEAAPNVRYLPACTWLHRCSDETGCCTDDSKICSASHIESVSLPFFVSPFILFFRVQNHFPKRSGGTLLAVIEIFGDDTDSALFFLLRSQSGIAHMSARLFCLGPKFFELFFLSHDCPN